MPDSTTHPHADGTAAGGKYLLREVEAAHYLGFQPRTMQEWRLRGGGPKYVKVSARAVRYRPEDLRAWAAERLRTSTSDPGPEAVR
ncbi:MAG: helix-turn-helix transcriptional regulator [Longimicrobiaceae bacterium]